MFSFFWMLIILFGATVVFYAAFASFIYYWHEKKTTVAVVPMIFTFEFLLVGLAVVSAVYFTILYRAEIFEALKVLLKPPQI